MILTDKNDVDISHDVDDGGEDFTIDMESMGILIQGFSDNLYSNKIGTIVREITSNCFDAHAELGIDKNVLITINNGDVLDANSSPFISFQDFGIGLSPDRVKNIYRKYFSSTKRDTNGQIGGFGIGAKSPLAYTDMFEVMTRVDGIEYHYLVHKGAKVPRVELLSKNESDDERGTTVKIPLKSQDIPKFKEELKAQLKFFDNVSYVNCGIDNDYTIFRGKNYIIRSGSGHDDMQMCIGSVAYPMDFNQLGLISNDFQTEIALRFDIGEIPVTMTRESVEYTDAAIKIIKDRIEQAKEELSKIYEKQIVEYDKLWDYVENAYQSSWHIRIKDVAGKQHIFELPKYMVDMSNSIGYKKWMFKGMEDFQFLRHVGNPAEYFIYLKGHMTRSKGFRRAQKYIRNFGLMRRLNEVRNNPDKTPTVFRSKGKVTSKILEYLKDTYGYDFIIIGLNPPNQDTFDYFKDDNTYNRSAEADKQAIYTNEFKTFRNHILKDIISFTTSLDDIEIPEAWDKAYKEERYGNRPKNTDEITFRVLNSNRSFNLEKHTLGRYIEGIKKDTLIVFAHNNEEHLLRRFVDTYWGELEGWSEYFFSSSKKVILAKISKDNSKKVQAVFPRAYHVTRLPPDLLERFKTRSLAKHSLKCLGNDAVNKALEPILKEDVDAEVFFQQFPTQFSHNDTRSKKNLLQLLNLNPTSQTEFLKEVVYLYMDIKVYGRCQEMYGYDPKKVIANLDQETGEACYYYKGYNVNKIIGQIFHHLFQDELSYKIVLHYHDYVEDMDNQIKKVFTEGLKTLTKQLRIKLI